MKKRILTGLLSLVMILALLPVPALAAEEGGTVDGQATVTLKEPGKSAYTTPLNTPYIDIANNEYISFRYSIEIDASSFFDTHVKPLTENGKWKDEKHAASFTVTIPTGIFSKYLDVDWGEVLAGTLRYKIKSTDESGIVLQGKENTSISKYTSNIIVSVPVTLPKDKFADALKEGALNLNGTAVISNAKLGTEQDLKYTISHSITVEDSTDQTSRLTVTGPDGVTPTFDGGSGQWQLGGSGPYTVSGIAKNFEGLKVSGNATLTLDNATIQHTSHREAYRAPAISIEPGCKVEIILSGANTIVGGPGCAGIYVAPGAMLTISGSGSLNVTGGDGYEITEKQANGRVAAILSAAGGAGIGGNGIQFNPQTDTVLDGSTASFGEIIINNGEITAVGGDYVAGNTGGGAGIGTGGNSTKDKTKRAEIAGKSVEINGGTINATGGRGDLDSSLTGGGAGIGSGGSTGGFYTQNSIVNIEINDGTVTALGMDDGAGIGGGANVDGGSISITGGIVTATGGYEIEDGKQYDFNGGAGIGGGDSGGVTSISITGGTVTAKAIGAAAGIGSGNDGFVGHINEANGKIPGSISIGRAADVTAYGGSAANGKSGGAGIGAGRSTRSYDCCGEIVIAGTAIVKAYAGTTAQAIGLGTYRESDLNSLTIDDTVTLWAQNQDNNLPALLNGTASGTNTLNYTSTNNYLVFNTTEENKAVGYFQLSGGEGAELSYTFADNKLTIGNTKITAAKPDGNVGNWATIYQVPIVEHNVTFNQNYEDAPTATVEKIKDGQTMAKPTAPTRDGYVFKGWYTGTVGDDGSVTLAAATYDFNTPVTADTILYAKWVQLHTVTYDLQEGTPADSADYEKKTVEESTEITLAAAPTKNGYTFTGWSDGTNTYQPGDPLSVTGDIILTAQWSQNIQIVYYTLHYESGGGTAYKDQRCVANTTVQLDKVPVREGYQFTGWYADKDLTEKITSIKMTGDKTVYAGWRKSTVPEMLNGEDHFAYIIGYGDGTVRPGENISRAEVATIFFRLLKPELRDGNLTSENPFTDVAEGKWFNKAVSTLAKLNIFKGRTEDTFAPDAPITRAEFAAICARFDTGMTEGDSNFTDISGHWAEAEIERAASLGWIMGYEDGTFRPNNCITRAEAMTMINRVLCRIPESEDDLLPDMNTWPDNQPGAWYYLAVQEATNSHGFRYKGEIHEHWTDLTADPDWTRYQ